MKPAIVVDEESPLKISPIQDKECGPWLEPKKAVADRKVFQCFILLLATSTILGQGLAAASAGFILPQIWDPQSGDSIQVSRETGSWFGKIYQFVLSTSGVVGGLGPSPNIWNNKNKCVLYKRAIKLCVRCSSRCPVTSPPSAAHLTVSLFLCSSKSNARGESRVRDGDEGVSERNERE